MPKGKRHSWRTKNLGLQNTNGMVSARTEELHQFTCSECGSRFDVFVRPGRTFRPTDQSVAARGVELNCERAMLASVLES